MYLRPLDLSSFRFFGEEQVIELIKDGQTRTPNREEITYENNRLVIRGRYRYSASNE